MAASSSRVINDRPEFKEWLKFFEDAGLSKSSSAEYAKIFFDHRIKSDHLKCLDENHLKLMKIERVGDIISILHHSKNILRELACDTDVLPETKSVVVKKIESKRLVKNKSCGPTVSSARVSCHNIENDDDEEDDDYVEEEIQPEEEAEAEQVISVPVVSKVIQREHASLKRKLPKKKETSRSDVQVTVRSAPSSSTATAATRILKKARRVVPPEASVNSLIEPVKVASSVSRKAEGAVKKRDVFSRLGEESPTSSSPTTSQPAFHVTDNFGFSKTPKLSKSNETIFSRLGSKTVTDSPDLSVAEGLDASLLNDSSYLNEESEEEVSDYEEEELQKDLIKKEIAARAKLQERLRFANRPISNKPSASSYKAALPYMGILKTPKQKKSSVKQAKLTTMRADEEQQQIHLKKVVGKKIVKRPIVKKQILRLKPPPSVNPSFEGILGITSRIAKNNVKERLGRTNITSISVPAKSSSQQRQKIFAPTQDKSIGSTTTTRKERKPIVYDLKSDDEDSNQMPSRNNYYTVSRKSISPTGKNVTFRDPMIDFFPSNRLKDSLPRGSIAMQTGVYRGLGHNSL